MKLFLALIAVLAAAATVVYSGAYDIGADAPHWPATAKVIETLRDRSIAAHARGAAVPDLGDPQLIHAGAHHYAEMCTGCHLAPGQEETEIRAGLYPAAPKLTQPSDLSPAEKFWVIKHGVKLTAMPAWGATHDDPEIWGLVAFVEQLPGMSAPDYARMAVHEHGDHFEHGTAESQPSPEHHEHGDRP